MRIGDWMRRSYQSWMLKLFWLLFYELLSLEKDQDADIPLERRIVVTVSLIGTTLWSEGSDNGELNGELKSWKMSWTELTLLNWAEGSCWTELKCVVSCIVWLLESRLWLQDVYRGWVRRSRAQKGFKEKIIWEILYAVTPPTCLLASTWSLCTYATTL